MAENPTVSNRLPDEVVTCLENSRFLHLATCTQDYPHVSLMNYTYIPPTTSTTPHLPSGPTIIMTSNPTSKKTHNLLQNPHVSLLVHDWVSSRPPHLTHPPSATRERSPASTGRASSLASMLMQMNSAAVSSISATINGEARVLEAGTEEERWCRERHLANHSFEEEGEGGGGCYVEGEDVRVVVVRIRGGRISDWKGVVKDWVVGGGEGEGRMVNGGA